MDVVPFPRAEEVAALASFEDISCVQPDGKTSYCKCKKCDIITTKSTFNMWRHWKYACPFKLLFKYNSATLNPNRSGSDMTVICLVCHEHFEQKSISFMITHRKHCKDDRMNSSYDPEQVHTAIDSNSADSMVIIEPPSQIIDVDKSHVIEMSTENSTTDQHPTKVESSYRIEPLSDSNHLRFSIKKTNNSDEKTNISEKGQNCAELQICENLFDTNSKKDSEYCKQDDDNTSESDDVLFVINTEPIENTYEQLDSTLAPADNEINDSPATPEEDNNCFICNSSASAPFVDLYGTATNHSKTNIYSFVWKLLGGRPSARNDSIDASCLKGDVVCAECLEMINGYDEARLNVKRYKKHLRERLNKTEAYFESLQNAGSGTTTTDEIGNVEGDGESLDTVSD